MHVLDTSGETSYRRRHFRVPVIGMAQVRAASRSWSRRIENLSLTGAKLAAPVPGTPVGPSLEDSLTLALQVIGAGRFRVEGRVVRRERDGGLGVRFTMITRELEDMIQSEILAFLESVRTPRTIVVDLDAHRRRAIAAELRRSGQRAIEVSTPLEAIDILEETHAQIAAILVAECLTQTGGRELLDFVRDAYPEVRIDLLS